MTINALRNVNIINTLAHLNVGILTQTYNKSLCLKILRNKSTDLGFGHFYKCPFPKKLKKFLKKREKSDCDHNALISEKSRKML